MKPTLDEIFSNPVGEGRPSLESIFQTPATRATVPVQPEVSRTPFLSGMSETLEPVATGVAKGQLSTLKGLGTFGQTIIDQTAGRVVNFLQGKGFVPPEPTGGVEDVFRKGTEREERASQFLTPESTGETVGFTAQKIAEFFAAGAVARPVIAGINAAHMPAVLQSLARVATQAGAFGGVSAVQEGEIGEQAAKSAVIGGAFAGGGEVINALSKTPAGQSLVKYLTEKIPGRKLNQILRPATKEFSFGKDPGATVAKEGITGNTRGQILTKIGQRKQEVGNQMDAVLSRPEVANKTINAKPLITEPIQTAKQRAIASGDRALWQRLDDFEQGLTKTFDSTFKVTGEKSLALNPKAAQDLKIQIGRDTGWTGQAFDNQVNQVKVAVYRNLDKAIDKVAPEMATLNGRYGGLLTAEKALERAIAVHERNVTLGLRATGIGGAIGGAQLLRGDEPVTAALKGVIGAAAFSALGSPAVQTRVAQMYRQLTPENATLVADIIRNITLGVEATPEQEK